MTLMTMLKIIKHELDKQLIDSTKNDLKKNLKGARLAKPKARRIYYSYFPAALFFHSSPPKAQEDHSPIDDGTCNDIKIRHLALRS